MPRTGHVYPREIVLPRRVHVAIWQWPKHRVLWARELHPGELVQVVAEDNFGEMICNLTGDQYCVLWPEDVAGKTTPR